MKDTKTGLSIKFVQQYDPSEDREITLKDIELFRRMLREKLREHGDKAT